VQFANPSNFYVGGYPTTGTSTSVGVINVTGGTMVIEQKHAQTDGYGILLGYPGTGILNVGGAGTLDLLGAGTAKEMIFVGVNDGTYIGTGIVNLGSVAAGGGGGGGGTIVNAGLVKGWGGSATFNFHGGTLGAAESKDVFDDAGVQGHENDASFMDGFAHAYIYSEGAKITVAAGHSSQIDQVFEDPTGYGLSAHLSTLTGGSGYIAPPLVTFGGGSSGVGATANAVINAEGEVTGIVITNPGTDYQLNDPNPIYVTFSGGGGDGMATATINASLLVHNAGGTFEKLGDGELYLTAANTYSGATLVKGGTLKITDIQNGGTASPIGKSAAAPGNLVLDGGALYYTGPAKTTDRGLTVGPGNGTVKTDNHLTFTGNVVEGADGGLIKDGPGALTLSGNLTYTGATDIKTGLLEIAHTGSTVNLAGGVTSSTGAGDLSVLDGVALTTPSITVHTLTIGGSSQVPAPAPVPEPGTWLLLALAGLGALAAARRRK
jgi:autotransporter-associated beta strand protein